MSRPVAPEARRLLPRGLSLGTLLVCAGVLGWASGSASGWLSWLTALGLGGLVAGVSVSGAQRAAERQRRSAALEDRARDRGRLSRRLERALGAVAVGVWEYDIDRDVLTWDRRTCELYGLGPGQTEHRYGDWRARLHPDDVAEAEATFRAVMAGRERYESRFRLLLAGGEVRHIRASGARFVGSDGIVRIVGINWDATDDIAREEEVHAKRREAEATLAVKSRLLARMSHEVRMPMAGVRSMLDLLLEAPLDAEEKKHAEIARASAGTLRTNLGDILPGLETGRVQVDPVHMRIGLLVDEVVALFRPIAEAKGVPVTVEVAPQVPTWLVCDPVCLRQIVVELLGNAIRFTGSGRIAVRIGYVSRTAQLSIAVEDTGIGIEPEDASRLFQPLPQPDASARRIDDAGCGLAVSYQLAGLMGGAITVESTPGRGSTFVAMVTAPRGTAPDAAAPEARVQRPLSVLLVEDNRTNQMVVSTMLQRAGHWVSTAGNGMEALEAVRGGLFDVILMDVEMPVMDGLTATRAIREVEGPVAALPIVALTANAMAGDRERYIALGMSDYLSKPIDPRALAAALARAAGMRG